MKKLLSILLAFTLLTSMLLLFSCNFNFSTETADDNPKSEPSIYAGAYDGSEVTINVWHTLSTSSGVSPIERASYKFMEMYPNITIKTQLFYSYEQLHNFSNDNPYSYSPPNLTFCNSEQILKLVNDNKVIALDGFINSQYVVESTGETMGFTQEQLNDFVPAFWEGEKLGTDGKMYSLPFLKETEVLYYNKTAFEELGLEPPTTWDEMEECIKVIKEHYPDSTPLGYDSPENLFITLAAQYGSYYIGANGEYLFANDTNKAFVSKFAEWYQKGWLTTSYITHPTIEPFANQQMFMSIATSLAAIYHYPNRINEEYEFELAVASIPQVDPSNPKANTSGISFAILDSENAQEIYASWLFLKYLTTDPEVQGLSAIPYKHIPVINSAKESKAYKDFLNRDTTWQYAPVEVIFEQECNYFVAPVFNSSVNAKSNVGLLVESIFSKYQLGEDNSQMIDEEFRKALDECKK